MQEMITSKAWGHGLATLASDGSVLDVWYPNPQLGDAPKSDALWVVPKELDALVGDDARRNVSVVVVRTEIDLSLPVSSTADAYLRLHLLSHLLVQPNTINLDNLLPSLPIVAFTSAGPVAADELDKLRPTLQRAGITVHAIEHATRRLGTTRVERGQPVIIALPLGNERPDFVDGHCARLRYVRALLNERTDSRCDSDEGGCGALRPRVTRVANGDSADVRPSCILIAGMQ